MVKAPLSDMVEPFIVMSSTVSCPPVIVPVVVMAEEPLSIAPKPDVIEPEFNAPVVTMSLPPANGLNNEARAVPPKVIASASNVPSISASPETSNEPASSSPVNVIFLNDATSLLASAVTTLLATTTPTD